MSCRYKDECPSYSGWCEGLEQDFSKCIPFLITAYKNLKDEKNNENKEKSITSWEEREVALACEKERKKEKKANLTTAVPATKAR